MTPRGEFCLQSQESYLYEALLRMSDEGNVSQGDCEGKGYIAPLGHALYADFIRPKTEELDPEKMTTLADLTRRVFSCLFCSHIALFGRGSFASSLEGGRGGQNWSLCPIPPFSSMLCLERKSPDWLCYGMCTLVIKKGSQMPPHQKKKKFPDPKFKLCQFCTRPDKRNVGEGVR